MDMSRIRIEGLLAAFPKLVGMGKQHTYIETENVRYVYQPIEALFLLLVTTKQSNILEDLDTLRMLSKLVCFFVLHSFYFLFLFGYFIHFLESACVLVLNYFENERAYCFWNIIFVDAWQLLFSSTLFSK